MDTVALLEFRDAKDRFFAHAHESPLSHEARHDFDGLRYYDPNPALVFRLSVEEGDQAEVRVGTSDGAERTYRRAGVLHFEVDGEDVSLTLYSTGHEGYFLPFRDSTSGRETYGAGRYLDLEPNADGTVTLDFNYAYNPTCAYDEAYSCPLPPSENWLRVPIEAGEKDYAG
ncbi:MAG TPA: DUF1684 domain-containing protein [Acidimicrobiia bacterium]|nr:DUF1684 domain-containing protein [Acidimicrobiia bacterium]